MSATTARDAGPNTADAAHIAADVVVASNAAPSAANDEVGAAAEKVKTAEGRAMSRRAALAVDAEEAEHRHKALMLARIRLSSAPAALKEKFASVAEASEGMRRR